MHYNIDDKDTFLKINRSHNLRLGQISDKTHLNKTETQ